MKKLVIIVLLIAMGITVFAKESGKSRKERRAEREAALVEQTQNLIESNNWQFEATRMLPARGGSRSITNYRVIFKQDMMESYLPFMGRAYSIDYGSNQSPMIFDSDVENYTVEEGRNGSTIIKFRVKNKSDRMDFSFNISPNGSASLSVNSTNRGNISYHGNIVEIEKVKS